MVELLAFDFITLDYWKKVDPEWRSALMAYMEDAGDNYAASILDLTSENCDYSNWPDSFSRFLNLTRDLALPRMVDKSKNKPGISKHILTGMSGKKIHEVELMSEAIHQVASERDIASIIDLGSGQGYLSRALAFDYNLEVLAVDMSEIQTKGAIKFDNRAIKIQSKKKEIKEEEKVNPKLQHVTEKITPENISQVLARWSPDAAEEDWLVTGLHTCGDLSPMILRLFAESKQVTTVVNVGCCYHALSEQHSNAGFPMSNYLKEKDTKLGTTARVLSCHSPSLWIVDNIQQSIDAYNNNYFRALLQDLLVSKGLSDIKDPPILGRVKQNKKFPNFVKAALKRMKLPEDAITAEEAELHLLKAKESDHDKQFIAFWTLRVLIAPIIESIILVDRWLYLTDAIKNSDSPNKGVWMYPLFDLSASPRNVVFIASK
ncbi:hypothetical protein K501DRAFT_227564 [Backusella circina FSU 941]|nr:hypothetical protein K501DRAFT_227564 [Backusella circina FSU 941]